MLKSQEEYEMALRRIEEDRHTAERQRIELSQAGLTSEEVERAMEPLLSFHAQLIDEVRWHEQIMRGDYSAAQQLGALGRLIIAVRLRRGISREEFARRLGVD